MTGAVGSFPLPRLTLDSTGLPTYRPRHARWLVGAVSAVALHGAVAAAVLLPWQATPPPPPPPAAEVPIMIDMAPLVAPPPPPPPPPEAIPEPEPEPLPLPKIETPPLPAPEVALPPPKPVKKKTEPKKEPPKVKTPPQPQPVTEPVMDTPPDAPPAPPAPVTPAVTAPSAPSAMAQQAAASWQSTIQGILERKKRYPRTAQARRQEARVVVSFILNAQGEVLSTQLVSASPYESLNEEVLDLLQRASPLPPPPPETMHGSTLKVTVPIDFTIRR